MRAPPVMPTADIVGTGRGTMPDITRIADALEEGNRRLQALGDVDQHS
ncbi:MAG: hypothetical protein GY851_13895 [bacterium]|nr:hypothetical protein [bacterium]